MLSCDPGTQFWFVACGRCCVNIVEGEEDCREEHGCSGPLPTRSPPHCLGALWRGRGEETWPWHHIASPEWPGGEHVSIEKGCPSRAVVPRELTHPVVLQSVL